MRLVGIMCLLVAIVAAALMLVGLWKPWAVLWWEANQNRRKVIKLYGVLALLSYLAYRIITSQEL